MSEWSRRDLLRVSGAAAVAVPITALSVSPADAATHHARQADAAEKKATPAELAAFSSSPVMFVIHDASRGEVSILHGESEVVVRDHGLVSRIVKAARSAQKAG